MKSFNKTYLIFLLTISLITTSLFVSGCGDSKRKVVIYSPHGKEMLAEFEKQFEAANPDIDVQWLDMGSQEVYDRVRNENMNPQADIWWGSPSTLFMKAEKDGLLAQYTPSWSSNIAANHKSKSNFWYGTFLTPEVISFNNKVLTKETAPKSWDEVTAPAWDNKIVIRNPMASGTMRIIYSAMIENAIKQTGNDSAGFKWLLALDKNTASYAADPTQMYLKLSSNETPVTLWNMPDIILQSKLYNYPFDFNFPQPSTVVVVDAIALINGSQNPEDAKKVYEFITSQDAMILQAQKFYRIPSRTDIPKDKLPDWIQDANYNEMELDWEMISQKESEWMKKWDSEIKSKGN